MVALPNPSAQCVQMASYSHSRSILLGFVCVSAALPRDKSRPAPVARVELFVGSGEQAIQAAKREPAVV